MMASSVEGSCLGGWKALIDRVKLSQHRQLHTYSSMLIHSHSTLQQLHFNYTNTTESSLNVHETAVVWNSNDNDYKSSTTTSCSHINFPTRLASKLQRTREAHTAPQLSICSIQTLLSELIVIVS